MPLSNFTDGDGLIAVFEPRTNTRPAQYFSSCLSAGIFQCRPDMYPSGTHAGKDPRWTSAFPPKKLVAELTSRRKEALYFPDADGIIAYLSLSMPGPVTSS